MSEHVPPPQPLMSLAVQPHRGRPREIVMDEAGLLRLARDVDAALRAIRAASDRLAPPGEVVDATIHEAWCAGGHGDDGPCGPEPGEVPLPGADVLLTFAARDDDVSDMGDDPTDSVIGDDEPLPDCATPDCGHAEAMHTPQRFGEPIATGPCANCTCAAYTLPKDAPDVAAAIGDLTEAVAEAVNAPETEAVKSVRRSQEATSW